MATATAQQGISMNGEAQASWADHQVMALRSALHHGSVGLDDVPKLLRTILEHDLWRQRYVISAQESVTFDTFHEFVQADDPHGLGTTVATLRKFCQAVDDEDSRWVEAKLDELEERPAGRPREDETVDNVNSSSASGRPAGNTRQYALRRLRNAGRDHDDPEMRDKCQTLHEQVLEGEKSPNAAMVEAGFRKKRVSFQRDVDKAAEAIAKNFSEDEIAELVKRLMGLSET